MISLSLISKSVEFEFGNLSRAVPICQELPKEIPKNTKENIL